MNTNINKKPSIDVYSVDKGSSVNVSPVLNSIITLRTYNGGSYASWIILGYQTDSIRSSITRLSTGSFGDILYISNQSNTVKVKNTNSGSSGEVWVLHLSR